MKKTILVLGANGFIGRNLINYVLINDLMATYSFVLAGKKNVYEDINGLLYNIVDLVDQESLEKLIITVAPNYIINLAGVIDENLDTCISLNAEMPKRLIEIIISNRLFVDKLLLIGSAAEYGGNNRVPLTELDELKPLSPYGVSKVRQTDIFTAYSSKININLARTFNIIGPYISNKLSIGSFIEKINNCKDGDDIYTGNLSSKRDYLHIDDVIEAFFKILFDGKPGEIYNVCSGRGVSMYTILDSLIKASGKVINVKINSDLVRKIDVPVSFGDNKKLLLHTGWIPKIGNSGMFLGLFNTIV